MKAKDWKMYACLIVFSLFMFPGIYDGQVMLVKVKFEKGAIGTPHTHYHTQTTYVASGKFEFTVGNEKKIVKAGDGIYIEPDILHSCVCLEPGVLIDCFAPMRADFLK